MIVKFETWQSAPPGGGNCVNFETWCIENNITLYKSEPADREAYATYLDISHIPNPCPSYVVPAEHTFSKYARLHKIRKPLDVEAFTKLWHRIYDTVVNNQDAIEVDMDFMHEPTRMDDEDGHAAWCEGNRSWVFWIKEARPKEYYIERFKSHQTT